ncbi:MAG: helix-turn-helix domain-containing protein [Oscillospiraceae bacterium]|nr:helix-turn-helix domain-containing protein [Oscillospiraceae bacterium]
MLKENLQILRKQKGMSQETLAQQLNVVRQTISKWEKGLSVPDADMLIRIADVFDTSVSELLGVRIEQEENVNEIAVQLALLNEQLARKVGICKKAVTIVIAIICVCAFAAVYPQWNELWRDFGRNLYCLFNQ